MTLDERQYESLGRRLDGAPVRLDADQQAAADEIRRLERAIGPKLDTPVPPAAMIRVRQQMLAAIEQTALRTARRPHSRLRPALYAGSALAAAAAIALAVWAGMSLLSPKPVTPVVEPVATVTIPVDKLVDPAKMDPVERQIDLLAREVTLAAVEGQTPQGPNGLDARISVAEQEVQDFYLDGPFPPPVMTN